MKFYAFGFLIGSATLFAACGTSPSTGSSSARPAAPLAVGSAPALPSGKIAAFIVVGHPELIDSSGQRHILQKGDIFQEGSIIVTGPNTGAVLVLSNGATVSIKQNAIVKINRFLQAPFDEPNEGSFIRLARDPSHSETEINVSQGVVQYNVKELNKAAGSTFVVHQPEA